MLRSCTSAGLTFLSLGICLVAAGRHQAKARALWILIMSSPLLRPSKPWLTAAQITPSEKLEWHPCFAYNPAFKCARLTVPMDYHRPLNESADNPKVHVALVLVPGKHQNPQKFSTSPLLLNPGGPGGSGVGMALGFGERIHKIVGEDQDVIGFDPRGVGATTPRADCFSSPAAEQNADAGDSDIGGGEDYALGNFHRLIWLTAGRETGNVNSSTGSLEMLDARAKSGAKLCQAKDALQGKDSIFRYVNTPNVVRDMVSIIDAWDEWTDSLSPSCEMDKSQEDAEKQSDTSVSTKGKLIYWGFSYGTLLGATFAAMFPDRVGRVVLDGVVDADHYVAPVWMDSIQDADAIFNSFPRYCHEGQAMCPLYRAGDEVEDVEKRFYGAVNKLKESPLSIADSRSKTPVVVTYSDIRRQIFPILYSPTYGFFFLGMFLDFLEKENWEFIAMLYSLPFVFEIWPICKPPLRAWMYPNEANLAIMCSDKRYPLNETIPNLESMFEKMSNTSSFADVWMTAMLGCEGWGIEAIDPPMRWDDHPSHKKKPIKTSFPVLFLSNTYDPVTPLRAGVNMAKKFVNAGLIEQKSMGHCSLAAVSRCTIGKIRAYFTKGEVPPPPKEGGKGRELEDGQWDRCEADEWPFHPYLGDPPIGTRAVDAAEVEAMNALKEMQEIFAEMKHWGQLQAPKYSVTKAF